ncbi:MAG: DNA primase [Planctomycetota bacterium]
MARHADDNVRRVKEATDIVELVSSYIPLQRAGARWRALCPFHQEKTPSFYVNPATQLWRCFGCNRGGDALGFVQEREGLAFGEALELLARRAGITLVRRGLPGSRGSAASDGGSRKLRLLELLEAASRHYQGRLAGPSGEQARRYLEGRAIRPETVAAFRLGWAEESWSDLSRTLGVRWTPAELERAGLARVRDGGRLFDLFRGRLMIPILDVQGQVVGFGARVLGDGTPKYLNSPETELFHKRSLLFGFGKARRTIAEARCAVLVEGYTDVMLAHQGGVTNAVATLGTALTDDHCRFLRRHVEDVILVYDADEAGLRAAERALPLLLAARLQVRVVVLPGGQDPGDFFTRHGRAEFEALVAREGRTAIEFQVQRSLARAEGARASASGARDGAGDAARVRAGREAVALLKSIEEPVALDVALHRASELLAISEGALHRALRPKGRAATNPREPSLAGSNSPGARSPRSASPSSISLGSDSGATDLERAGSMAGGPAGSEAAQAAAAASRGGAAGSGCRMRGRAEREVVAVLLRRPALSRLVEEMLAGVRLADERAERIRQAAVALMAGDREEALLDAIRLDAEAWAFAVDVHDNERDFPVVDPERVLRGAIGRILDSSELEECRRLRKEAARDRDHLDDRMRRFVEAQRRLKQRQLNSGSGPGRRAGTGRGRGSG